MGRVDEGELFWLPRSRPPVGEVHLRDGDRRDGRGQGGEGGADERGGRGRGREIVATDRDVWGGGRGGEGVKRGGGDLRIREVGVGPVMRRKSRDETRHETSRDAVSKQNSRRD